ncbi:uncharacterized protein LOC131656479 [Vicia villosa]|uniref:uncharacterized protein LOC131656479 n=1 Tax=Vicia villosa TaxID=3911 RepID=UPI00273BEB97|nr:uncharacterized protein LOC131656479 [Vicia villosa]
MYASPLENNKKIMWEELHKLAEDTHGPWLVAGDFNDIAHIEEKRGGVKASMSRCTRFRNSLQMCKLTDLEARGPKFTWRGPVFHGGQRIYEKLDRAVSNDEWRLLFPEAFVKVLMRVEFSDHHPIIINLKEDKHVKYHRPFRFENAWLLNETYDSMLHES